jgi:hypothetical protein
VFVGKSGLSTCGKIEKVDDSQCLVAAAGRPPGDEVLADPRRHHHAPAAQSHPDGVERRDEVGQARLPHVVAEIQRIAAVDQQDVGRLDEGYPVLFSEAG